jgi:hypothetical protein
LPRIASIEAFGANPLIDGRKRENPSESELLEMLFFFLELLVAAVQEMAAVFRR